MMNHYDLYKIDDHKYVTFTRLNNNGFEKEMVHDFIASVREFIENNSITFFTYYYLVANGFNHDLIDYGFNDVFYEELIATISEYNTINTRVKIFSPREDIAKMEELFVYLLNQERILDVSEVRDFLETEYRILIEEYKIVNNLRDHYEYYSDSLNKIYADKQDYIREVYK